VDVINKLSWEDNELIGGVVGVLWNDHYATMTSYCGQGKTAEEWDKMMQWREPEPVRKTAHVPKRRVEDDKWLHDSDLDRDHRYWTLDDLLDPERK
jgi:hypothetical protein